MNTETAYKEYFGQVIKVLGLNVPDIDKYLDNAIMAGLMRCWGASDWSFKEKVADLTITSAKDYWDLPADFDSMLAIREENSQYGMKLIFMSKEQFDEFVPKQGNWDSEYPTRCTIFNTVPEFSLSFILVMTFVDKLSLFKPRSVPIHR